MWNCTWTCTLKLVILNLTLQLPPQSSAGHRFLRSLSLYKIILFIFLNLQFCLFTFRHICNFIYHERKCDVPFLFCCCFLFLFYNFDTILMYPSVYDYFLCLDCVLLWIWASVMIWLLCFLTEKLSGRKLNVAEVTQSEIGQKQKLQTVLEAVNRLLRPHGWTIEWSVDSEL